jgi:hypothetical protein
MARGSTQPLTEIITRNLPGGKGRPARLADNLSAICETIFWEMWEARRLTTLWTFTARYGIAFTFYIYYEYRKYIQVESIDFECHCLIRLNAIYA